MASDTGPTIPGVTAATLPAFLLEVCAKAVYGELRPAKGPEAVRAAGDAARAEGAESAIADALCFAWVELGATAAGDGAGDGAEAGGPRARLVDLAKELLRAKLVSKAMLMERCEGDLLEETGLILSAAAWKKKVIKINTRMVYTQQKYNLMCEETEGYAKLTAALHQFAAHHAPGRPAAAAEVATLRRHVQALVGQFDIDPNRALDLVLEVF